MTNKQIKDLLIYDFGKICFFNGTLCRSNILTMHHIKPVRQRGRQTVENGSLVALLQHSMFNVLEVEAESKAKCLTEYLKYFKATRDKLARIQAGVELEKEFEKTNYEVCKDKCGLYMVKRRK